MSQSRFSIVLVGVSALLRRPLVSRLRPADGERSSWVVFTARVGRFDSGGRSAGWPSGSLLPLFGTHRFGVAAGRVRSFAFRFGNSAGRVGLRAHCFRFSARADSEWLLGELVLPPSVSEIALGGLVLPLGGLVFGLTASAFRHAPLRSCRSAGWPSGSLLPLFGMYRFGLTASAFRLAPLRRLPSAGWPSGSPLPLFGPHRFGVALGGLAFGLIASEIAIWRVGLRAHRFRFSARTASEWPLGEFVLPPSASELPFGGLAFGFTASAFRHAPLRSGLGGLAFGLTASAFRYAPLRGCPRRAGSSTRRVGFSAFRFGNCPRRVGLRAHRFRFSACAASEIAAGRVGASAFRFGDCRWAGWPSGSLLPLFDMHRSAPPHRRSEDRRSTPTRHLFHFKTLIPTC